MGIPSEIYTPSTYKIVHNTSVDFRSRSVNQPVHLVQYDDTLPIIAVKLYADGSSFSVNPGDNTELELRFGKLDNTFSIIKTLGLDNSKTIAYFEISPQMTLYHGDYYPVLSLTYDKTVAASSPIHFIIDRNPVQNGMIESSNEFTRLLDYVDDARLEFETWFQNVKDQLSTDVAGHLQEQINEHEALLNSLAKMLIQNVITMPIELSDGTLLATTDNEVLLFEESHVIAPCNCNHS